MNNGDLIEVGAVWQKPTKNGGTFFSIKPNKDIDLNQFAETGFLLFQNKKNNDRQPDYKMYGKAPIDNMSALEQTPAFNNTYQPPQAPMAQPTEDDIPF